jgi:hypothetical protein
MNLTRVDTKKLRQAVAAAKKNLAAAEGALEPFLPILTSALRNGLAKPRAGFPKAARTLAAECADYPDLVAAVEFDAEAMAEDLDNVAALDDIGPQIERLQQMLDDARLLWLAEAFVPTLELYGVAKVRAKKDGKLAKAIAPLADVLANPRKKAADPKK